MKSLSKLVVTAGLLAASGLGIVAGCEEPAPPPPPARPLPPPPPATWQSQTARLNKVTPKLADEIDLLPGNTMDHRRLAAAAFKDLAQFLIFANGPTQSPGFANRVSVMTSAADTLAKPNVPRGRLIAVENQALHSAVLALSEISTRYLFDDPDLAKMVETAKTKVNEIDGIDETNGVMHDLVAADAFETIKPALLQIDQDMHDRFGADSIPMEMPAGPPAGAPTGEMPATSPAGEPSKPAVPPKPAPDLTASPSGDNGDDALKPRPKTNPPADKLESAGDRLKKMGDIMNDPSTTMPAFRTTQPSSGF